MDDFFRDEGESGKPGRGRKPNRPAARTRDSERVVGPLAGSNPALPATIAGARIASREASAGRVFSVEIRTQWDRASRWTVLRQERKDGPVFPIRLEWTEPLTPIEVWAWLLTKRKSVDPEWKPYRHFEAYPTDETPKQGGQPA